MQRAFAIGASEAKRVPMPSGQHGVEKRFEDALGMLPIRQPPLPIQQYLETQGSHQLVIRPKARDFYCIPVRQRSTVVAAYSTEATAVFRKAGIYDVSFVVDALRSTRVVRPLARARDSSATLTSLGRERGQC